jgi:CRP-like cAMP-binding protein
VDQETFARMLSKFYLFAELKPEQIEQLAIETRRVNVPRGSKIFDRGAQAHGFYLLLDGQVKLGMLSPQGGEKVIDLINPGGSFGEAALFMESPFPVFAQAITSSRMLLFSKHAIFNLLDKDPTLARRMLAGLSVRMHQLIRDIEMLSLQTCSQRLINYLLQISLGSLDPANIRLPANKSTIASMLNITPETLSRIMLKLQNAGLIDVHGKEIAITDVKKLREYDFTS